MDSSSSISLLPPQEPVPRCRPSASKFEFLHFVLEECTVETTSWLRRSAAFTHRFVPLHIYVASIPTAWPCAARLASIFLPVGFLGSCVAGAVDRALPSRACLTLLLLRSPASSRLGTRAVRRPFNRFTYRDTNTYRRFLRLISRSTATDRPKLEAFRQHLAFILTILSPSIILSDSRSLSFWVIHFH